MDEAADVNETSTKIEIRTRWGSLTAVPLNAANQFAASVGLPDSDGTPDGVYLTLGNLQLPILMGGSEELEAIQNEGLTVSILGRYVLTRSRLEELIGVLRKAADQYDSVVERKEEER